MQYQTNYICLSPQCQSSMHRICNYHNLSYHKTCQKWLIDLNNYFQYDQQYISPKNWQIDFYEQPMQSIKAIKCLQNSFKLNEFLKRSYQLIKKRIDEILRNLFQDIHKKISEFLQDSSEIYEKLIQIVGSQSSLIDKNGCLNNSIFLGKLQNIELRGKVNLFNQRQLEYRLNEILMSLTSLTEAFIFIQSQQSLQNRIDQNLEIYNFQNNVYDFYGQGLNEKVQTLSSMFNCKPPEIQLNSSQNIGRSRCFICEQQAIGTGKNNKQKKKQVFVSILQHMKKSHQQVILHQFKTKISKATTYKISMQSFMNEIYQTVTKKFIIIDRANAGNFQLSYWESNSVYAIEILSKNNQKMAKGRYLIANSNSKDSVDLFSVIIIYELFKVPNAQVQLITKDHYGKTLSNLFMEMGKTLICLGNRRIQ